MKRFASHYVYLPSFGFLKKYVTEINDEGYVVALYRLEEEMESMIWTPGVIRLMPEDDLSDGALLFDHPEIKTELPAEYNDAIASQQFIALRLYPYDFSGMKASANTVVQLLNNATF